MKLTAIMAVADGDVIGKDNAIPWRLPPDLKRFKALTTGHAIIMGRKTYESIGRPLPNRRNIVLTRTIGGVGIPGCFTVHNPDAALVLALEIDPEPFVIGGAGVWSALWKHVTHVEMTRVQFKVEPPEGSLVFGFHMPLWKQEWLGPHETHEGLGYQFMRYRRIASEESLLHAKDTER